MWEFLCLGAMNAKNMAGGPHALIPMSAPPLKTSSIPLLRSNPSVTPQICQLLCVFTVKVLTDHERCQYGGRWSEFVLHMKVVIHAWKRSVPRSTVHDGSPTTVWGGSDGGPNGSTHAGSKRPTLCADVYSTLAPVSAVLIQTCESDTS